MSKKNVCNYRTVQGLFLFYLFIYLLYAREIDRWIGAAPAVMRTLYRSVVLKTVGSDVGSDVSRATAAPH